MNTVTQSLTLVKKHVKSFPELLIIFGSGWNRILKDVTVETELSYKDLFDVEASVPGHDGKLVIGTLAGKRVAMMSGRLHTYEGYTTEEVTRPLQTFAQAGVKTVFITAAAGALNEHYRVGDFIIMNDMVTAFCPSPLTGPTFIDLSQAFDPALRHIALNVAHQAGISAQPGVYCYVRGPHFETPADKMLYHHLGADIIGMSTVPETIMARSLDVKVLGLGFVTNLAFVKHAHEDVLAAAEEGSQNMVKLLKGLIAEIG